MALALLTAGTAFAAFCVWLGARIINRRERWAMWTLAAALIVGCPIAFNVYVEACCKKPMVELWQGAIDPQELEPSSTATKP